MAATATDEESTHESLLLKAADLYRLVPNAGGNYLSMTDAMKMVGIEGNLAKSGAFQGRMKQMLIARTGKSPFKYDDGSKIERTVAIYKFAMRDKSGLKKLSMADAM
jgi:hypothetical protein